MVSKTLVVVFFLAASVYGELSGFSMMDNSFGSMIKRQGGYYPTTHTCGQGATCEEACGAGQITCPSTSSTMYCYDPTIGDTCCPDGSGNSCSAGYFCTSDSAGNTYCCPSGMSLSDCGAAYSLTVALISETGTVAATAVASSGSQIAPSSVAAFTSSSVIHIQPTTKPTASLKATSITPSRNATVSTASTPAQVTANAANANGFAGAAVALGFAGVIAAL